MTTFKVGDRVRLKAEHKDYWKHCRNVDLSGEQVITQIDGDLAGFGNPPVGHVFLFRLELVPPAVTIDPAKKYRTREGCDVRIYATDGAGDEPIHGAYREDGEWWDATWDENGAYYGDIDDPRDLIEVKPEISGWVNVYDSSGKGYGTDIEFIARRIFGTKKEADDSAATYPDWTRIACLKITFRAGDGLEGRK